MAKSPDNEVSIQKACQLGASLERKKTPRISEGYLMNEERNKKTHTHPTV
jgi:hypothetical protein